MTEYSIQLPEDVKQIIGTLKEYGYEAYAVGGCIRDSIILREPGDWDITTSAKPEQVKSVFRRTVDTGIEHGTVTVLIGKLGYEVTTYRIDGDYKDSRHPSSVEFTSSLVEDLKRRDFTINAMAYNEDEGLIDEFEGLEDIQKHIIRCVGDPKERFNEDALRMLRAIRFAAQLDFSIEDETAAAIRKLAATITRISKERIHTELNKLLLSDFPELLFKAGEVSILEHIFPDFHRLILDDPSLARKCINVCRMLPSELPYKYAAVLFPFGELECRTYMRSLKLDNNTINTACKLVRYKDLNVEPDMASVRHAIFETGDEAFLGVIEFQRALIMTMLESGSDNHQEELNGLDKIKDIYTTIKADNQCISMKQLALTGNDLKEIGIAPGQQMGQILAELLQLVLTTQELNNKETLIKIVKDKNLI